jgi:hypothetical protein
MLACSKVTMSKIKGGLGLKNMRMLNGALLIKCLDKLYNKKDIL